MTQCKSQSANVATQLTPAKKFPYPRSFRMRTYVLNKIIQPLTRTYATVFGTFAMFFAFGICFGPALQAQLFISSPRSSSAIHGAQDISLPSPAPVAQAAHRSAPLGSIDVSKLPYGAKCDWNGKTGTDNTAAFQAAASAANAKYIATGKPVSVHVPENCEVVGRVTFGSGVHWIGPGSVIVPNQSFQTFYARNADDVSIEGLTFDVLSNKCGNKAECAAIFWGSTADDNKAHSKVVIRNNIVIHSNWGILVGYASGTGSLADVEISDNIIKSPPVPPFLDADGIHIGGQVTRFNIHDNQIYNRGDAGIAVTSETNKHPCSGGVITNNVLIEDRVGLDNSGCSSVVWQGNFVRATAKVAASNPAFRSIGYLGVLPTNILVLGNYLQNASGYGEFAAKVDDGRNNAATYVTFSGNTILSLYLRGTQITVTGNTFLRDAVLKLDYDGPNSVKTDSITIGKNLWLGQGKLVGGVNPGLMTNIHLADQTHEQSLSLVNQQTLTLTRGSSPGSFAAGKVGTSTSLDAKTVTLGGHDLEAGSCLSATLSIPGATRSMVAHVSASLPLNSQTEFVPWAFVTADDLVTLKVCAIEKATLPPTSFNVIVQ
jgi:hypothetical protein